MHLSQRSVLGIFLYHFSPYFFEVGFLCDCWAYVCSARLAASDFSSPLLPVSHSSVPRAHECPDHTPTFLPGSCHSNPSPHACTAKAFTCLDISLVSIALFPRLANVNTVLEYDLNKAKPIFCHQQRVPGWHRFFLINSVFQFTVSVLFNSDFSIGPYKANRTY